MAVPVFTKTGGKSSSKVTLPKSVFGIKEVSHDLLHQVYVTETTNMRNVVADTKTRGNVRGGGRKPWRQKGTGRARAGSIRSPLWKGGGIVFGPSTQRNHVRNENKKVRRQALAGALSIATANNRVAIIDGIDTSGKTKDVAKLLNKIDFARGTVVVSEITPAVRQSFANIPQVNLKQPQNLTVRDVLDSYQLLISKEALAELEKRAGVNS